MKRISLISRIRLRRAITYLVLPFLAVLVTLAVTTDLFNTHKVAKAITISSGKSIPASAENQDVIVTGVTIYMDYVAIDQSNPARPACFDSSNSNCDTKRVFKSLTLEDGAVITHTQASARDTSVTEDTTGLDRWRKVDIELTGNLKIKNGSRIDVDGKGYPGGVYAHKNGYGPKGGYGIVEPDEGRIGANGGWHKGDGGRGFCIDNGGGACVNPAGGAEFEGILPDEGYTADFEFDFGSGGGHANQTFNNKPTGTDGGAGGGRIKIQTNGNIIIDSNTSRISADGNSGSYRSEGGDEKELSGAGAGGSVFLSAKGFSTPASSPENNVFEISAEGGEVRNQSSSVYYKEGSTVPGPLAWGDIIHSIGSDGVLSSDIDSPLTNVFARGGASNYLSGNAVVGAAGGGGEVRVTGQETLSIRKKLIASKRDGAGDSFNPYALQLGDEIIVELKISNLSTSQLSTITDEYLALPDGSIKCKYFSMLKGANPVTSDTTATWTTSSSTGEIELKYYCKVQ